jgi:hypothetical protein
MTMPRSLQWILDHQDELADRAEQLDPDELVDVSTPEMVLRRAAWKRAEAEREIAEAVAEARDKGVSWRVIGDSIGTSAQSAQRRYSTLRIRFSAKPTKARTVKGRARSKQRQRS